jgi:DNA-nicking Smr family endonuclease
LKPPRGLSASEAALWRRVADTVTPLDPPRTLPVQSGRAKQGDVETTVVGEALAPGKVRRPAPPPPPPNKLSPDIKARTLDGTWDRRLAQGLVAPDAEIDLHGLGLDAAYTRLMASMAQATVIGARVLLVIAGKSRPHGEHDQRGNRRGAIRAKLLDWLAASPHASRIAAIRPAHQRHGGAGAVYVVLRKSPETSR